MTIWFDTVTASQLNDLVPGTLMEQLGIEFTDVGDDYLRAAMPMDERTCQPEGLLHGGASAALAETLASVAGHLIIDRDAFSCVGLAINANHIRPVREGYVVGTVRPIHLGRSTQVHEVRVDDHCGRLVCVSRVTLAVVAR